MEVLMLQGAAALYLGATIAALAALVVRKDPPRRWLLWLLGAGLVLHGSAIALRSFLVGQLAVTTLGEALSVLAFLVLVLFLALQRRAPLLALAAVVVPLAFGLTLTASVVKGGARPVPPVLQSVWLPVHVGLAILGDALFALAFSASLLYLVQERRLKARRGVLRHVPSLETLDRVSYRCLVWGMVLLTLGIVSGIVWAHAAWDRPWLTDLKLLFTLAVWTLYMVLLQGRMSAGWRGRRAARITIAGFTVLVLSLIGVNVFGLGSHGGMF